MSPSTTSPSAADLATEERKAARHMSLVGVTVPLVAAVMLWVLFLIVPYAGPAHGYDVAFFTPTARSTGITITEYVFTLFLTLGVGLFTTVTLLTRRAWCGMLAWVFSTLATVTWVFAVWLRQTRPEAGFDDNGLRVGIAVAGITALLAAGSFILVALRRDDQQRAIADSRASSTVLDAVGTEQQRLLDVRRRNDADNPLLQDDRRQTAHQRYRTRGR